MITIQNLNHQFNRQIKMLKKFKYMKVQTKIYLKINLFNFLKMLQQEI